MVAETMSLLKQQQAFVSEHHRRRMFAIPILLRRLGRENESVIEEMQRIDLRILDRKRNQDQVELAGEKLVHEVLGERLAKLPIELGEAALQFGQHFRQEIGRDRGN